MVPLGAVGRVRISAPRSVSRGAVRKAALVAKARDSIWGYKNGRKGKRGVVENLAPRFRPRVLYTLC